MAITIEDLLPEPEEVTRFVFTFQEEKFGTKTTQNFDLDEIIHNIKPKKSLKCNSREDPLIETDNLQSALAIVEKKAAQKDWILLSCEQINERMMKPDFPKPKMKRRHFRIMYKRTIPDYILELPF